MRTFIVSLGILCGLTVTTAARADQTPDAPKTQPAAALPPGEYVARVVVVKAKAEELVLQIATQRQVLKNPNGPTRTADQIAQDVDKDIQDIGQLDRNAAGFSQSLADFKRKQEERNQAVAKFQQNLPKQLNELQQQQVNPQPVEYVTLTERKDLLLAAAKDVRVRILDLPPIEEDGRVRTSYTSEEIKALKGKDPSQPGFDGKLRDLNAGDYVRVTLVAKTTDKKGADAAAQTRTEISAIAVLTKEQAEKAQAAARP